ncbi:MAG: hypothetical protein IPI20_13760 [Rhodoferax sp.]|nr:hypothetical protein [Rhodoferax sp.]
MTNGPMPGINTTWFAKYRVHPEAVLTVLTAGALSFNQGSQLHRLFAGVSVWARADQDSVQSTIKVVGSFFMLGPGRKGMGDTIDTNNGILWLSADEAFVKQLQSRVSWRKL